MEGGLAGPILGEAHIPTGIEDDRRAAEWRLVQKAQSGDLQAFDDLGGDDLQRLTAWVDQQLDPGSIDDTEAENRIASSGFLSRFRLATISRTIASACESSSAR